jgi:hypothetical protein
MSEEDASIIELNVGGVYYSTTLKTLLADPNSYLHQLFFLTQTDSNKNHTTANSGGQLVKDSKNKLFIDRDGLLFRYILDYLRNNRSLTLPENFGEKRRLKTEAEFYRLNHMSKLLDDMDQLSLNGLQIGGDRLNSSSPLPPIQRPLSSSGRSPKTSTTSTTSNSNGCIVIGYRGTFANGREGVNEVKFRKITRILVSGRVNLCREVFGETLNENRDPDHGVSDRYTSRFYLKHTFVEQAFDTLLEAGFYLACVGATNANSVTIPLTEKEKNIAENEENKWMHYNEYVFIRNNNNSGASVGPTTGVVNTFSNPGGISSYL